VKAKKQVARTFTEAGKASICFMCRLLELPRSSFYILSKVSPAKRDLEREIVKISEDKPRYGYRRVAALMRRSGKPINVKRVQRVRSRHGLQVRKKQRKTRRIEPNSIKRLRASKPNEVWSWDFVYDETANGQGMRILSVVDEFTRQCFSLRPRRSYRATDVIEVLDELILKNGSPVYLRSDNGPEFIAYALQDHLAKQGINTHYIKPGSPWEQPYVESFHDKLRDELLNREIFYSLEEAKIVLSSWKDEYNAERPHSSLKYQTPNEYAEAYAKPPGATRPRPPQADVSLTTPAIHIKPRTNTMTLV
jgi:transposase InsO family protein